MFVSVNITFMDTGFAVLVNISPKSRQTVQHEVTLKLVRPHVLRVHFLVVTCHLFLRVSGD